MRLDYYTFDTSWDKDFDTSLDSSQTLVLVFGLADENLVNSPLQDVKKSFENSIIMGASTIATILMDEITQSTLLVTVIKFENTSIKLSTKKILSAKDSYQIAKDMTKELQATDLKNIFVLSDGLKINGSQLADGFNSTTQSDVSVSGGLAGDNGEFQSTWILIDGEAKSGYVSAVGLYGDSLQTTTAFHGGWDVFGIKRKVTKSLDNTVYELDNHSILAIYKKYLGEHAQNLPASGLLFPLGIYRDEKQESSVLVRTILGINEEEGSITFAGDVKEGSMVALMKSNNDRLIDAALTAGQKLQLSEHTNEPILNIAISCIGRKLVLKNRVDEELEAVLEALPKKTLQVGFYSFGELSPDGLKNCDLHNQTMTLMTLWEKNA